MDRRSALKILHLGSNASVAEVKRSYRKLATRYHPDHNAGNSRQVKQAGQKMQELNCAYTYLLENAANVAQNNVQEHPDSEYPYSKIITFPRFTAIVLAFLAIVAGGLLLYLLGDSSEKNLGGNNDRLVRKTSTEEQVFSDEQVNQLSHGAVKELQQRLAALEYTIGVVDGYVGPKTMTGLQSYCTDFAVLHPCSSMASAQGSLALHAAVVAYQPEWRNIVQDEQFHRWLTEQGKIPGLQTKDMQVRELVHLIDQFRFAAVAPPRQPLPTTGVLWQERKPRHGTRLTLDANRAGKDHFLVKLIQLSNNQDILYGFIRGGEQWEIILPPGDHQLKIAAGDTWFGKQYLFGPETKTLLVNLQSSDQSPPALQTVELKKSIQTNQISHAGSVFDF